MFSRYFGDRYFAPRYWPNDGAAVVAVTGDLITAAPAYFRRTSTGASGTFGRTSTVKPGHFRRTITSEDAER